MQHWLEREVCFRGLYITQLVHLSISKLICLASWFKIILLTILSQSIHNNIFKTSINDIFLLYSSVKDILPAVSVKTPTEVCISGSETDFSDYEGGGEKESTLTARVRQCSLQAINSVIDVSVTSAKVQEWKTYFLLLSFFLPFFSFFSFFLSFLFLFLFSYYFSFFSFLCVILSHLFNVLIDVRNWIG